MTPHLAALTDGARWIRAREIVAIWPAMPTAAPFIDPCAKGHRIVVRDGWLVCSICGRVLGKAPRK